MTNNRFLPPAGTAVVIVWVLKFSELRPGKTGGRLPSLSGSARPEPAADQPEPEQSDASEKCRFRISQAQSGISLKGTTTLAEVSLCGRRGSAWGTLMRHGRNFTNRGSRFGRQQFT